MPDTIDKDKLMKLIRLLSTDKDGEKLAAIAAIERHLKGAKLSFHELADTIAGKIIEAVKVKVQIIEKTVDRTQQDWIKAADELIVVKGKLTQRELEFVTDMRRRFILKTDYAPTDKQTGWFISLYKKHVQDKESAA